MGQRRTPMGAAQWLFVAALAVWTLLLAAVVAGRMIDPRRRLQGYLLPLHHQWPEADAG